MHKTITFYSILFCLTVFTSTKSGGANPATSFIENRGQWHEEVLFKAAIPDGDLFVLKNGLGDTVKKVIITVFLMALLIC